MLKMFLTYQKKDKIKFLTLKILVLALIVGSLFLAVYLKKIELPTMESKLSFGMGFMIALVVVVLAVFNRIRVLFKIKAIGFVTIFLILLLLKETMDTLIITIGLVTIPLVIDDIIINPYFKYLNITKYWETYRYVGERTE